MEHGQAPKKRLLQKVNTSASVTQEGFGGLKNLKTRDHCGEAVSPRRSVLIDIVVRKAYSRGSRWRAS